jgi:hypothetical protein
MNIQITSGVETRVGEDGIWRLTLDGFHIALNTVGGRIWEGLQKGQSVNEIGSSMVRDFSVPRARVDDDIAQFLVCLRDNFLISLAPSETAT